MRSGDGDAAFGDAAFGQIAPHTPSQTHDGMQHQPSAGSPSPAPAPAPVHATTPFPLCDARTLGLLCMDCNGPLEAGMELLVVPSSVAWGFPRLVCSDCPAFGQLGRSPVGCDSGPPSYPIRIRIGANEGEARPSVSLVRPRGEPEEAPRATRRVPDPAVGSVGCVGSVQGDGTVRGDAAATAAARRKYTKTHNYKKLHKHKNPFKMVANLQVSSLGRFRSHPQVVFTPHPHLVF